MLSSIEASEEAIQLSGLVHRVYQPHATIPQPCVVFVHGRAGDAKVMWVFSKALERIKPVIVSPQGTEQESIGGYSWWNIEKFPPGDASLTVEEKLGILTPSIDRLENFIDSLPELYNVDPQRLYAVGFSQGAGLLASFVVKHPGIFKGVAFLSGFIPKTVREMPELLNPFFAGSATDIAGLDLPSIFVFHGKQDEVLPLHRGEETQDFFAAHGADVVFRTDDVGHKVSANGIKELRLWFEDFFVQ